ncbi:MAG: ABC transporter permease [Chloroflexota bacterium]
MNERVRAIIAKEWEEARKNSMIVLTAAIPALIFAVMPAFMIWIMKGQIGALQEIPAEVGRAMFGQFLMFFILLPVIIPSTMASYSIIGEKQNRSLEPLLATPIATSELLLGKSLASVIPSVVLTWLTYILSIAGVYVVGGARFLNVIFRPEAIAALLLLAPAMAILGMLLIVLISSRSSDPREAQQWSVFIVLPAVGLGLGVTMGKISVTVWLMAAVAAGLAVLDLLMLRLVTRMFQRELILTRWK